MSSEEFASWNDVFVSNSFAVMRSSISVLAHTSYGWSNPSKAVLFSTLPDIPTSLSPPTFSLQCADMMSKSLPAYYCNCTLSWEAAKDNGSPITSYLVQVNPANSNFNRQKDILLSSISDSEKPSRELKAGARCRVAESEGWVESVDELVTVLLDNQTAFERVSKDSVEVLPFPPQSPVLPKLAFDVAEKAVLYSFGRRALFLFHQPIDSFFRSFQRWLDHRSNRRPAFHNSPRLAFFVPFTPSRFPIYFRIPIIRSAFCPSIMSAKPLRLLRFRFTRFPHRRLVPRLPR